jgi:ABC-type branched-subunit amino acid transport system ATPase component/ABC-type branched-subunit amino acid transport system permease subunit
VGFAGQLAIGYVALLTVGAYTSSVLVEKLGLHPVPALAAAAIVGGAAGVIVGLPALRLRTFYFAMTTLGFATIVTQVALAWKPVTGGGMGLPGPVMPAPFDGTTGFYMLCVGIAALCTWMTLNVAGSRFGRNLVALRDAEVAAEACGVRKAPLLLTIFLVSGALAGVAGGLFATLQSYITPDAFTFDLSVLFFIAILIGGRGSVLGPLLATLLLTALPEFAAPLVAWSTFLYAALLLAIVLLVPGGIAALLDFRSRRPLATGRAIVPALGLVHELLGRIAGGTLELRQISLNFGAVRAIDDLTLEVSPGEVHGLIGPNGSGKTTTLNAICGFARPQSGHVVVGGRALPMGVPAVRAAAGIARTFQTPRIVGEASVLENVMVGGSISGRATMAETLFALPRHGRDEAALRARAREALTVVGLQSLAEERADRLQHSELRFVEIARALMPRPRFLLLDEPAAGLSPDEISKLGQLIQAIARAGTGVLLVEHHADLIFAICDRVTVLNLGRVLASGTPAEVRAHREVVDAYLGR